MESHDEQWPWFAVLTRFGRERRATMFLENTGYECYLPVRCSRRRWSDRWKKVETPLFPGYFFCRMNPHDRLPVLSTPGVHQILGIGKTPIPVDDQEIAALQRVEEGCLSTSPWPYVEVGHIARIGDGPLKGVSGIVTRIKSEIKLILSVSLLRRSVAVEIDRKWIEDIVTPQGKEAGTDAFVASWVHPCRD
jgi:transcription antitermination factor NusG